MPIPLITNFTINQAAPVDDRMVVTSSSLRDAIQYKYDGLTVFQTDTRSSWTWNATSATWSYNVAGNGIYSGSGSVVGDTYINLNSISTTAAANTTSNLLGYYSNLTSGVSVYYLNTYAIKKAASPSSQLSFKIQNSLNSTGTTTNYSYIEFNPDPSSDPGSIGIGNNATEYLRISNSGNLNLWKGNLILWSPTYSITFNTSYLGANNIYYLPNKTGILAMTSDISTLAATVSAISLQTVTNVGATTSSPVSMLSSLNIVGTFSVGNISSTYNQLSTSTNNIQKIDQLNSSQYVITGSYKTNNSFGAVSNGFDNFFTISIPTRCHVYVEVETNITSRLLKVSTSGFNWYLTQNKIIYSMRNVSGSVNILSSNTLHTYQDTFPGVYSVYPVAVIGGTNTLIFRYQWSTDSALSYSGLNTTTVCNYKIIISAY